MVRPRRPASVAFAAFAAGALAASTACGGPSGEPAAPVAEPRAPGEVDEDAARQQLVDALERARASFDAACRSRPRNLPELCTCAWEVRVETFTVAEIALREPDEDPEKLERFLARVGARCRFRPPEGPLRERMTSACARGRADAAAYCTCRYEHVRDRIGVDALYDLETPTTPAYRAARLDAIRACAPKLAPSAVRDPFLRDCVHGGGSLRTCDCLWASLLREATPAAIDEGDVPPAVAVRAERACAGR